MNSLGKSSFNTVQPIQYFSKSSNKKVSIEPALVLAIVEKTNIYLSQLNDIFKELGFDFYSILGQRNLSGFVGEIFSRYFSLHEPSLKVNPHADGRPDLLDLSSSEAINYYHNQCFTITEDDERFPIRNYFAPFKYGGLEVKATIGNPSSSYKKILQGSNGSTTFKIGVERVNYLKSITYWGHHQNCDSLLGLYYDYPCEVEGIPQVLAVFHALLNPETDWNKVSIGKKGSKKTSNTSLTSTGIIKIYNGIVVATNLPRYSQKFMELGIKISSEQI